jgi:hypothetical protein
MFLAKRFITLGCFVFAASLSLSAHAKDPNLEFFDVFLEPGVSLGWGDYAVEDDLDKGTLFIADAGGRGGVKLGPIYLGFEYRSASPTAWSDEVGVADATRIRYPLLEEGQLISIGPAFGIQLGGAHIWTSILANSMKRELTYNDVTYEHKYSGIGSRYEVSFNIYKNIHVGVYYQQFEFNEYSSTHPSDLTTDDEDLDPRLSATAYGLTFSYFVPLVHAITEGMK